MRNPNVPLGAGGSVPKPLHSLSPQELADQGIPVEVARETADLSFVYDVGALAMAEFADEWTRCRHPPSAWQRRRANPERVEEE